MKHPSLIHFDILFERYELGVERWEFEMRPNLRREQEIAEFVAERGSVPFSELCERFSVSSATMRRDLVRLEEAGLIERSHGSARPGMAQGSLPNSLTKRMGRLEGEKAAIGKEALGLVSEGDSVVIDASTTCLRLAEALASSDVGVTVITNYFDAALALCEATNVRMLFVGGNVAGNYHSTTGGIAEGMAKSIQADVAFIGTDAIDPERGLTNNRIDIIPYKQLVIRNARRVVCLADHTKLSNVAVMQVAPLDDIDLFITDFGVSPQDMERFAFLGDRLRIAPAP